MAWYHDNHGELTYVSNGDPRGDPLLGRDGLFYPDPAPVTFRTPPFYSDGFYRRSFRDQYPDPGHGGHQIPAREQVLIRREDPLPYPNYPTAPWWHNRDHPHGGYPVWVVERPPPDDEEASNLEFYAPQLCCDSCERRVVECLNMFPGVQNVVADQWEKKVVVEGRNLRRELLLNYLQRISHMERSDYWSDRG